jgi:phosphatidylglycerol:prolipoprotein diacylglycerol transferase
VFPSILDLGFFRIPTYGVLLVTGIVVGLWTAHLRARKAGEIDPERVVDFGIWVALWGLLGSKLLLVLTEPAYVLSFEGIKGLLRAGGVFYGGLIAALVAAVVLVRRYHLALGPLVDTLAPSVALAHFFGRLGCFGAGCCYGAHCEKPWSVIYSHPLAAEVSGTPLGQPLHPTQLYEAAFNLLNYAFLAWLFGRRPRPGRVLASYLVVYGVGRFVLELWRGDPDRGFLLGGALSTSQGIAIGMILVGGGIFAWTQWTAAKQSRVKS